ncbi:DUF6941 family protein [Microbacterium sp. Clip185]|uniref:DUF6941 family protein n=1 Tax=Microbacterium sp. Clip185 TaxID=3025663 RepID=UPI0023657A83|nr:hypothetical protein [Microbacterium sp. Clip185]WDG17488.1 hypothetical protein PQV94_12780 [Microbacterium sp. Clip185]
MHVSALVVCDAVTQREGLLNLLGGGVTYLSRASYPAPLMADIAVLVNHQQSDKHIKLTLTLRKDGSPEVLTETEFEGELAETNLDPSVYGAAAFAIEARSIALPSAGNYTLTAELQDGQGLTTNFTAVEAPFPVGVDHEQQPAT